ncbi:MAG: hypothetical protein ACRCZK_01575 [Oscillospiraceae bacterium]
MRTINNKNKTTFTIFAVVILLIFSTFSIMIIRSLGNKQEPRSIVKDSIVYDANRNLLDINADGTIYKKWDGSYSLELTNDTSKYNLGRKSVIYDINSNKIDIFGGGFEVFGDGQVAAIDSYHTTISNLNNTVFLKIDDRRYLMIGSRIVSDNDRFATAKYVEVVLDKAGNAQVINDKENFKTIKPMVLASDNFTFDISNETLKISENEIDLKRIQGSTNEYKPDISLDNNGNNGENNNGDNNNNNNDDDNNNENNSESNNNTNSLDGSDGGGSGGGNSSGNSSGNTGNNSGGSSLPSTSVNRSRIQLNAIVDNISNIVVNYYIFDSENKYISTFLDVVDSSGNSQRIDISKFETFKEILNTNPNNEYVISIGYLSEQISSTGESRFVETIVDTKKIITRDINSSIDAIKVSRSSISLRVKTDSLIFLESAQVGFYGDDEFISLNNIDTNLSMSNNGYIISFDVPESELNKSDFVFKIENAIYKGQPIEIRAETKVLNKYK